MNVFDVRSRERFASCPDLDRVLHRFDVSKDLGGAPIALAPVGPVGGARELLVRNVNALDPRRRHALRAQQVLRKRSQRCDVRRRSLQMLQRSGRFGYGCDGAPSSGKRSLAQAHPRSLRGNDARVHRGGRGD